jgi:hypothetical protein
MTDTANQPYEQPAPIDEPLPDNAPPEKKRARRTELERLELRYQSKQNVVETGRARVKAREDDRDLAMRELRVAEQELDLIGRMIELAKAQQELTQ